MQTHAPASDYTDEPDVMFWFAVCDRCQKRVELLPTDVADVMADYLFGGNQRRTPHADMTVGASCKTDLFAGERIARAHAFAVGIRQVTHQGLIEDLCEVCRG